jgi:hypothetical protein
MAEEDPLETFGRFLVTNLRDRGIDHLDKAIAGSWKAPALLALQRDLARLPLDQRTLVRRAVIDSLDVAIHDFLFALQEQSDTAGPIAVQVQGKDIAQLSDGLQGEPYGDDGWYARFSAYGAALDEP